MKKYLSRLMAAVLALVLLTVPASALTVDQALELLEENYYYELPEQAYRAATLEELFRLLDPYTEYLSAEEYQSFLDAVEDTVDMVGIGVSVEYTEDGFLVKEVLSAGGAEAAGLQPGDLIVAIEGVSCAPAGEEHRALLLGEEDSQVAVTVRRDGTARDFTITRRPIYIPNTEVVLLEGGIGYVDCNSFGTDTAGLLVEGLKEYDSQVSCWLLDLRGNTGGYVDSAIGMLAALNGPGGYLYFEDQNGLVTAFGSDDAAVTQKPLVVLVNGVSASASELVSAGVRDTGRGILVGSRTFGKGVAQSVLTKETDPGYFDGDCIKVTTARFYAAGASTTDRIGVIPTLLVDDGYTEAVALALTGGGEDRSRLCVVAGSAPFYVDPDAPDEVVRALLEAIPPGLLLFCRADSGGVFYPRTPAQAAELLGLDFDGRWFGDVEDSPYAVAIQTMGTYRLLNGTAPGVFSPERQLTRAQLCVMLARVLNVRSTDPSRYSDVADDAWYAAEVNAMAQLGLVNGTGGGKFDPDGPVTQQQLLTILGRTARYLNVAMDDYGRKVEGAALLPSDMAQGLAPFDGWARSEVAVLTWGLTDALDMRGDLLYTGLSSIDPSAPVLREEAAAGIYAVLGGLDILP